MSGHMFSSGPAIAGDQVHPLSPTGPWHHMWAAVAISLVTSAVYIAMIPVHFPADSNGIRWAQWVECEQQTWEGAHLLAWCAERAKLRLWRPRLRWESLHPNASAPRGSLWIRRLRSGAVVGVVRCAAPPAWLISEWLRAWSQRGGMVRLAARPSWGAQQ